MPARELGGEGGFEAAIVGGGETARRPDADETGGGVDEGEHFPLFMRRADEPSTLPLAPILQAQRPLKQLLL